MEKDILADTKRVQVMEGIRWFLIASFTAHTHTHAHTLTHTLQSSSTLLQSSSSIQMISTTSSSEARTTVQSMEERTWAEDGLTPCGGDFGARGGGLDGTGPLGVVDEGLCSLPGPRRMLGWCPLLFLAGGCWWRRCLLSCVRGSARC